MWPPRRTDGTKVMIHIRAIAILGASAVPALAGDPAIGVWQTEPDRKNLVSHIKVRSCGPALCGTVIRAFDTDGREVTTPHVGKRLFWDLSPQGGGKYAGGTVQVPLLNVTANASATVSGDSMRVTGCKGGICQGQTWTRLQ